MENMEPLVTAFLIAAHHDAITERLFRQPTPEQQERYRQTLIRAKREMRRERLLAEEGGECEDCGGTGEGYAPGQRCGSCGGKG